jgi:archaellum component FlaF (FlaF/FlaG flagellin family)
VKNTGDTHLINPIVVNDILSYDDTRSGLIAPGENYTVVAPREIAKSLENLATVTAYPAFPDETLIPDIEPVKDTDPSSVVKVQFSPEVTISNDVKQGSSADCSSGGSDKVVVLKDDPVTYCFTIENTGDSYLEITVTNPALGDYVNIKEDGPLAPGETYIVPVPRSAERSTVNTVTVVGKPVLPNGRTVPNADDVTDDNSSEVTVVEPGQSCTCQR